MSYMKHLSLDINKLNAEDRKSLTEPQRTLYWTLNMAKINWWFTHGECLLNCISDIAEDTGYFEVDLVDYLAEAYKDNGDEFCLEESFLNMAIIAYEQDL